MVIFRAAAILDSGTEIGVWLALVRLMKLGYCEAYTAFRRKHIALIGIVTSDIADCSALTHLQNCRFSNEKLSKLD